MKKVTLITYHHWKSKRRAGFHWLAEAYHKMGCQVVFVTGAISKLSKIKKDFRIEFIDSKSINKLIEEKDNFFSYTWFTNWHPVNLRNRILNNLSYNIFSKYSSLFKDKELIDFIKDSDAFIFESFPGIFLFDTLKNLSNNSKFIYRVSDDMRLLNLHPVVIDFEKKVLPKFDLVSVPSEYIKNIFP
ncbi:MAG: glucuronosyltransferase, partial [Ignavibacteriae bacterium]|nr:glucuronosyltransferase [Ignavibacteriota bacterium]